MSRPHKICTKCKIEKLLPEFTAHPASKDGRYPICKPCHAAHQNEYYHKNSKQINALRKAKYPKDREKLIARARINRYSRKYGITVDQYELMLRNQNYLCGICGMHQDDQKKRMCVDHCHRSGIIRGLLCLVCNRDICGRIDRRAHSKARPRTELEMASLILEYYKKAYG